MTKVTSRPSGDLQEAFHRAIVAFLKWHTENDMRAIYAYAAHHSHDFMWGFAADPETKRNCALRPEPKVEWNGRPRPISNICRAAESLSGPLPPLVRGLVEDVVSGILEEVETYAEAASILGEHIAIERHRPSPWLALGTEAEGRQREQEFVGCDASDVGRRPTSKSPARRHSDQ